MPDLPDEAKTRVGGELSLALLKALSQLAPIERIWVGDPYDRATWSITFRPAATTEQKAAAQAAFDGHPLPELPA